MKLRRHPKSSELRRWLEGGSSEEVDRHLETCDSCADALERLDAAVGPVDLTPTAVDGLSKGLIDDQEDLSSGWGGDRSIRTSMAAVNRALSAALEPPEGLNQRLADKVVAQVGSRELAGVVWDLFEAGVETSKILLLEDITDEDD